MSRPPMCAVSTISAKTLFTLGRVSSAKSKFGGMNVSEAQRLKALEAENAKLKRIVANLTLDNVALKDVLTKNW